MIIQGKIFFFKAESYLKAIVSIKRSTPPLRYQAIGNDGWGESEGTANKREEMLTLNTQKIQFRPKSLSTWAQP